MADLSDVEYEMVVFAIRAARVQQIQSVDRLRSVLRLAFPGADSEQIQRAICYIANRLARSWAM